MEQTGNTFIGGLNKDYNPIATPNDVLTDALNATFITFNSNELMLQNDMGNTNLTYYPKTYESIINEDSNDIEYKEITSKIREKVKLKEGYIPIGVKEHGDIIYIVSYNPEEKRTEIGSFPGPEYRPFDKIPSKEINKLIDVNEDTLNKIYNLTEEGDTLLKPYDLISDYSMEGLSPIFISSQDNKGLYIPKYFNVNTNQDITDSINIIYNYNPNFNNYKIEQTEFEKYIECDIIEKIQYTYKDKNYVLFSTNELLDLQSIPTIEKLENKQYNKFISYPNIKKGDIGVSYTLEDINGIMYTNNLNLEENFNYNNYIPEINNNTNIYEYIFISPQEEMSGGYNKTNVLGNKIGETTYGLVKYNSNEIDTLTINFTDNLFGDYLTTFDSNTENILSYHNAYNNIIKIKQSEYDSISKFSATLNNKKIEIIEKLIKININNIDVVVPALLYREV